MCYVIITGRSLVWLLLSVVALVLLIWGVITPRWLLGPPDLKNPNTTEFYRPTVGIYNRCIEPTDVQRYCGSFFYDQTTDSTVYPSPWKAALFFLLLSAVVQFLMVLAAVLACCLQAVCRKSVISLAGATQALAGFFGVIGLLLYPWGWGSERVQTMCGAESQPFIPGDCSLGWGLYVTTLSIALIFVASGASKPADKAACSDKVQFQMDEGRQLICLA